MVTTDGKHMRALQPGALAEWFARAERPWSPITVAGRHFNTLVRDNAVVPALTDFDDLYDVADLAVQWLEHNPCPDKAIERRLRAQMMGYRAVADTVRCTIVEEDGDLMVARLGHLRRVIDQHAEAIDELVRPGTQVLPECQVDEGATIVPLRRRVPRQMAGWVGICLIQGEPATKRHDCRVVDISMMGLGLLFQHPSPSVLVGRRMSVDVTAVGDRVNIRLEGKVTNATATPGGAARIGIEFDDSSGTEPDSPAVQSAGTSRSRGAGSSSHHR
jgi:PilZ domain